MDHVKVDYGDLTGFVRDLEGMPPGFMRSVRAVVKKGALNVKRGWRRRWTGHPSIRHLPRSLQFDLDEQGQTVTAAIGPDFAKDALQAPLSHLIEFANTEYGTLANAPLPGGQPSLDEEEPKFVDALANLGEKFAAGRRGAR